MCSSDLVWRHPIHGSSYIFVISKSKSNVQHLTNLIDEEAVKGLYDPSTYTKYASKCKETAKRFAETIRDYRSQGYTIVGYGAPAKGTVMMNFAQEKPDFTIEDSPFKKGLYTPGMSCKIISPDDLFNTDMNGKYAFVPLAWNFYDEIVSKIKVRRQGHTDVYIKYFPTFEITNG